jgi:hypothetical protein
MKLHAHGMDLFCKMWTMVMNIRYPQSTSHNHATAGDSLAVFPEKKQAITIPFFLFSLDR